MQCPFAKGTTTHASCNPAQSGLEEPPDRTSILRKGQASPGRKRDKLEEEAWVHQSEGKGESNSKGER